VTPKIIGDVLECQRISMGASPGITWPEIDVPGMPNMIRSAIRALAGTLLKFYDFVKPILNFSISDLTSKAAQIVEKVKKFISDFPGAVIDEIVKMFTETLVLPEFTLRLPNLGVTLKNILQKIIIELKSPVQAIRDVIASIPSFDGELAFVREWYGKLLSFITFLVAIPANVVKLIMEFMSGLINAASELIRKGLAGLMSSISEALKPLLDSLLAELELNVSVPDLDLTPPVVSVAGCLLRQVKGIIVGFPSNVGSLPSIV
jgi:phage-related protein